MNGQESHWRPEQACTLAPKPRKEGPKQSKARRAPGGRGPLVGMTCDSLWGGNRRVTHSHRILPPQLLCGEYTTGG